MSWHDPQPPVMDFWPTMGRLVLVIFVTTVVVYLLLA